MSKWFNADEVIKKIDEQIKMPTLIDCISAIKEAPSIDIVECKKCKYWEQKNPNSAHGWCDTFNMFFTPIFFCAYGEEKDNETNNRNN